MQFHRLILWDIDGTLVHASPAALEAFDLAIAAFLRRELPDHGVSMSGKTDPQIALEVMAALASTMRTHAGTFQRFWRG